VLLLGIPANRIKIVDVHPPVGAGRRLLQDNTAVVEIEILGESPPEPEPFNATAEIAELEAPEEIVFVTRTANSSGVPVIPGTASPTLAPTTTNSPTLFPTNVGQTQPPTVAPTALFSPEDAFQELVEIVNEIQTRPVANLSQDLGVEITAIEVEIETSSPTQSPTTDQPTESPTAPTEERFLEAPPSASTAAVVGGILGLLVVMGAMLFVFFYKRRQNQVKQRKWEEAEQARLDKQFDEQTNLRLQLDTFAPGSRSASRQSSPRGTIVEMTAKARTPSHSSSAAKTDAASPSHSQIKGHARQNSDSSSRKGHVRQGSESSWAVRNRVMSIQKADGETGIISPSISIPNTPRANPTEARPPPYSPDMSSGGETPKTQSGSPRSASPFFFGGGSGGGAHGRSSSWDDPTDPANAKNKPVLGTLLVNLRNQPEEIISMKAETPSQSRLASVFMAVKSAVTPRGNEDAGNLASNAPADPASTPKQSFLSPKGIATRFKNAVNAVIVGRGERLEDEEDDNKVEGAADTAVGVQVRQYDADGEEILIDAAPANVWHQLPVRRKSKAWSMKVREVSRSHQRSVSRTRDVDSSDASRAASPAAGGPRRRSQVVQAAIAAAGLDRDLASSPESRFTRGSPRTTTPGSPLMPPHSRKQSEFVLTRGLHVEFPDEEESSKEPSIAVNPTAAADTDNPEADVDTAKLEAELAVLDAKLSLKTSEEKEPAAVEAVAATPVRDADSTDTDNHSSDTEVEVVGV
jgi:hypothetical protein